MRKLAVVLGGVAVFLTAPIVASGQGIEAKLGDDTTATFVVKDSNNMEILVLEAKDQATESPNVIGGHDENSVTSGAWGATIGGGGALGNANMVTDNYGTVGGGYGNQAGDNAIFDKSWATVGGGFYNTASGVAATVPGGGNNSAAGNYSFAAGRRAKANNPGCFVWGDSTNADVTCSTDNRWVARTSGGVYFYSNSGLSTGVTLAAGGSSWGAVSDRAVKENFTPVDKREILEKVAAMPVEAWNLKTQDPAVRHIGPVAQDFNGAFGYGEEERYINMMDATGVTMAAVQGLYEVVQDQKREIQDQRKEIKDRDRRIEDLEGKARRMEDLEGQVKELARLVRGTAASE